MEQTYDLRYPTLNDIVFENRNKQYGAYDLRQRYSRHTERALWLGILLFAAGLTAPTVYDRLKPAEDPQQYMNEVILEDLKLQQPEEPPVVLPPVQQPVVQVPTTRYLPPEVLADAPEEVVVPTTDDLEKTTPSDKTVEGDPNAGDVIEAPNETAGPAPVEKNIDVKPKEDEVFIGVEQQPMFPGGMSKFAEFLERNLKYPPAASRAGISGKVFVQFIVNTDGSIVEATVIKGIGFGCDEEALRVIQKMPKWQPGKQAGRPVRVRYNLPIVFQME
ncbi:energy transducer TonB [Larkinella soli]|uniref:energy transducer TonB n=1 Tax=Larkinella soli TaxID=1770527 RepID=UPI000FFB20AC|nr:energy transducer TonB [Larkinella soli]